MRLFVRGKKLVVLRGLLVETKRQSRKSVSSAADRSSLVFPKLLLTN